MKTLILDIETSPNIGHVWGLWQQNVGLPQLMESGELMCWAAKWWGEKKVHYSSTHLDGKQAMLGSIYELVNQADAIVHYNGRSFDMKWLRSEWVRQGWGPPSGYHEIDLCSTVKRQFRFPSNKLEYVASELLGEGKVKHAGHALWVGCMNGDEKSWANMRAYNIADVKLTERLYDYLRPWCKGTRVA